VIKVALLNFSKMFLAACVLTLLVTLMLIAKQKTIEQLKRCFDAHLLEELQADEYISGI
jgi:hypothetical protein